MKVCELSPQTLDAIDKEINKVLQESYNRAKEILNKHKQEHKLLAEVDIFYLLKPIIILIFSIRSTAEF